MDADSKKKCKQTKVMNFNIHIYSMSGFANPLSIKTITDVEIKAIEEFIKKNAFEYLAKEFCNISIDNICEVDIENEQLINYFGPLYAHNTASFQFRLGDVVTIREIVDHVKKKVDEGGQNKNLAYYVDKQELKQRKRKQKENIALAQQKKVKTTTAYDEIELESQLIEKVIPHFIQAGVDVKQCGKIAELQIADSGRIYGDIFCAICKVEGRKNKKPKRVYCNFDGKNKGVWVLSNFVKHLDTVHKIKVLNSQKQKVPVSIVGIESDDNISTEKEKMIEAGEKNDTDSNAIHVSTEIKELVEEKKDENNSSVILVNDDALKLIESKNEDTQTLLYNQISKQIRTVMTAVYTNNESLSEMHFLVNNTQKKLKLAEIAQDGNCMFGSSAHQLFSHPLNSNDHKEATKKLRADVVEHILESNNFQYFLHALKDRVYATKNTNEIENIEMECKLYVRHKLAKNRVWGGAECLLAISDLYETNVIVFGEDDRCSKFKRAGKNYNRSIVLAYRFASGCNANGERMRNHYESVCDIDSDDLYAAAQSIA